MQDWNKHTSMTAVQRIIFIMDKETCDRCGHEMDKITTCHLICPNCGANYDCSDKGSVW